jgi:hypothetical protein
MPNELAAPPPPGQPRGVLSMTARRDVLAATAALATVTAANMAAATAVAKLPRSKRKIVAV